MNPSCFSRFDMEYHEVLLEWSKLLNQDCIQKVLSDLSLNGLEIKSKVVYTSKVLERSILHLCFDEDQPGFKKKHFASSERSGGSNALRKCEVPNKWAKHLMTREINGRLDEMFRDAADLRIHGDSTG